MINDFNLSPYVRAHVKERLVGIKWDKLNWSIRYLLIFCFTIKVKGCYGNGIWDLPSIQLSVRSSVHLSWTGLLTYWGDPNINLMKSEYRHIWYVCAQSLLNLTFYIKIGNFESNILYLGTFFFSVLDFNWVLPEALDIFVFVPLCTEIYPNSLKLFKILCTVDDLTNKVFAFWNCSTICDQFMRVFFKRLVNCCPYLLLRNSLRCSLYTQSCYWPVAN